MKFKKLIYRAEQTILVESLKQPGEQPSQYQYKFSGSTGFMPLPHTNWSTVSNVIPIATYIQASFPKSGYCTSIASGQALTASQNLQGNTSNIFKINP